MLLALSDLILALACLWAGWTLIRAPGAWPLRLLALALGLLAIPSLAGAAHFGGVQTQWLVDLHQGASDLYALLGFVLVAVALWSLPDGRRWPLPAGIALLAVAVLMLAGRAMLAGPLASLFILVAILRLIVRRPGPARFWLGLSLVGLVVAAATRVPGLLTPDARIIGLHLGLALWVLALTLALRRA